MPENPYQPPKEIPPGDQPAVATGCGAGLGLVAYAIAVGFTLACVPRRSENIREVVNLPWLVFALLPSVLAFIALGVASACFPSRRARLYLALSFSVAIVISTYLAIDVLRRAYIGKF